MNLEHNELEQFLRGLPTEKVKQLHDQYSKMYAETGGVKNKASAHLLSIELELRRQEKNRAQQKPLPACGNKECGISTGIGELLTFGSGELDDYGFWEKPCEPCASTWKTEYPEDACWPHKHQ